jgi:hypothetical protein
MFSRESGCSLIHPDPNEAEIIDFISSLETGILFRASGLVQAFWVAY